VAEQRDSQQFFRGGEAGKIGAAAVAMAWLISKALLARAHMGILRDLYVVAEMQIPNGVVIWHARCRLMGVGSLTPVGVPCRGAPGCLLCKLQLTAGLAAPTSSSLAEIAPLTLSAVCPKKGSLP